jgi:hypothetical protein
MAMTPLHLEILLHYMSGIGDYSPKSEVSMEFTLQLESWGLIDRSGIPGVTLKGSAWLNRALQTPLPTLKWTWEAQP